MRTIVLLLVFCSVSLFSQVLSPGDGIRVAFYNIPEKISGDYYIQADGSIQMPFIGNLKGTGRNFIDLKKQIFNMYDSLYKQPELEISPLYRINILGEVRQPGFYYITGFEKLSEVFALAGGESADADVEGTYLIRGDKEIELGENATKAEGSTIGDMGLQSGDRVFVPRRWWVGARNTAVIVSGAAVVVTLIGILVR